MAFSHSSSVGPTRLSTDRITSVRELWPPYFFGSIMANQKVRILIDQENFKSWLDLLKIGGPGLVDDLVLLAIRNCVRENHIRDFPNVSFVIHLQMDINS